MEGCLNSTLPVAYFGGKSKVAKHVWAGLGDVDSYIEPFFGSGAVLLGRPRGHKGKTETVNDIDQFLANFYRSVIHDADAVAEYADYPVNECVPAGTLISTPNGDIAVENICPGMLVWGEKEGQIVPTIVIATQKSTAKEFVRIGDLRLTENHPVWTKEYGYTEASQLKNDMHIAIADYPVVESDLLVVQSNHESTPMGDIRTHRPKSNNHSIYRCDVSGTPTTERTHLPRKKRRKNTSGLLDTIYAERGYPSSVPNDRTWRGRWMENQREILDFPLSNDMPIDKSDGWWRRYTWSGSFGENPQSVVTVVEGNSLCSWTCIGYEGQEPYTGSHREDSKSRDRSQTFRSIEVENEGKPKRQETGCFHNCSIYSGTHRKEANGRAQEEDCRYYQKSQSGFNNRNGSNLRLCYRRITSIDGERSVNIPSDSQRLSMQRESSQIPVTVYNFQTITNNYFANKILVHNCDLTSRHLWLVSVGKQRMQDGMVADPDWYDAKIAGWWLWGLNQWLGSGWCHGKGPWEVVDGKLKNVEKGGRSGKGVSKQLPQLSNGGVGQNSGKLRGSKFYNLMEALAWRLRFVRVACGDWTRVVTDGVTDYGKVTGVFLDPPYTDTNDRDMNLYANDSPDIAHAVREWAIANGDRKNMRIVLAGYEGEHDMPDNWRKIAWVGNSTLSSPKGGGHNEANRHRERLWFSPHCLRPAPTLFDL